MVKPCFFLCYRISETQEEAILKLFEAIPLQMVTLKFNQLWLGSYPQHLVDSHSTWAILVTAKMSLMIQDISPTRFL